MNTQNLPEVREVTYNVGQESLTLTLDLVRRYCVQGQAQLVTESELAYFLHECKARALNPLRRECYLIKYSQRDNAQIIEAISSKRNRARRADDCAGWSKGILLLDADGVISESPMPIIPPGKKLIGGYFRATPRDWSTPFEHFVELHRYIKKTKEGKTTAFWQPEKQAEMIRKVAESQGLTALWGDQVGAAYIREEFPPDAVDAIDAGGPMPEKITAEGKQAVGTEIYRESGGGPMEGSSAPLNTGKTAPEKTPPDSRPLPAPAPDEPASASDEPALPTSNEPASASAPIEEPPFSEYPDEDAAPAGDPAGGNWWDEPKNWRYRRGLIFYYLVRSGLGLRFASRRYEQANGDIFSIPEEMEGDFTKAAAQFPDAIGSLLDARPNIKKSVLDKVKTTLHFTAGSVASLTAEANVTRERGQA